jgi:hypothetical protein
MRFRQPRKIRELEEQAARYEQLLELAAEQLQTMKGLIDEMSPLVDELPRVAVWTTDLINQNRGLHERAERAERSLDNAVAMLVAGNPD